MRAWSIALSYRGSRVERLEVRRTDTQAARSSDGQAPDVVQALATWTIAPGCHSNAAIRTLAWLALNSSERPLAEATGIVATFDHAGEINVTVRYGEQAQEATPLVAGPVKDARASDLAQQVIDLIARHSLDDRPSSAFQGGVTRTQVYQHFGGSRVIRRAVEELLWTGRIREEKYVRNYKSAVAPVVGGARSRRRSVETVRVLRVAGTLPPPPAPTPNQLVVGTSALGQASAPELTPPLQTAP